MSAPGTYDAFVSILLSQRIIPPCQPIINCVSQWYLNILKVKLHQKMCSNWRADSKIIASQKNNYKKEINCQTAYMQPLTRFEWPVWIKAENTQAVIWAEKYHFKLSTTVWPHNKIIYRRKIWFSDNFPNVTNFYSNYLATHFQG